MINLHFAGTQDVLKGLYTGAVGLPMKRTGRLSILGARCSYAVGLPDGESGTRV